MVQVDQQAVGLVPQVFVSATGARYHPFELNKLWDRFGDLPAQPPVLLAA